MACKCEELTLAASHDPQTQRRFLLHALVTIFGSVLFTHLHFSLVVHLMSAYLPKLCVSQIVIILLSFL